MDVMNVLNIFLQVGTYSCISKPGMDITSVHLYTEEHRHPAVYTSQCNAGHCNATQVTGREYVPVVLPCVPNHPSVDISIHNMYHLHLQSSSFTSHQLHIIQL